MVISRAGLRPQDFSHTIVLLTAVHFHFAGFVLPILSGLAARDFEQQTSRGPSRSKYASSRFDSVMLVAICVGVPLVGLGISLSAHVEVAALRARAWMWNPGRASGASGMDGQGCHALDLGRGFIAVACCRNGPGGRVCDGRIRRKTGSGYSHHDPHPRRLQRRRLCRLRPRSQVGENRRTKEPNCTAVKSGKTSTGYRALGTNPVPDARIIVGS
jgi:hypothetical protein